MVGTKKSLRKVLGRSQATDKELATTLVNIEAALNSRPITQNTDNTLTPAYFLCGETDNVTLWSTTKNGEKSHEGTTKDIKTGR
jgi:hypothetical protein